MLPTVSNTSSSLKRLEFRLWQERPDMAQLLDVMPLVPPHPGALPILNWETHLVRCALLLPTHTLTTAPACPGRGAHALHMKQSWMACAHPAAAAPPCIHAQSARSGDHVC